jgi:hypothetical protein
MRYVLSGAEPKTDWDISKREVERDHLGYFLDSHRRATGEEIEIVAESETPDFIGRDADGNSVGVELTQVRFSPAERHMRRIFPPEAHDFDAFMEVVALMHKKDRTLRRGNWHLCKRKLLVIVLIDTDLHAMATGTETDRPKEGGFDEVWLADGTQIEIFGAMDLFAVVHPTAAGIYDVASRDRKPYG